MKLIPMLLLTGAVALAAPAPKVSFEQRFDEAVVNTNRVLLTYSVTDCRDRVRFNTVADSLEANMKIVSALLREIPSNEDPVTQMQQVEEGIGILRLSASIIDRQNQCIDQNYQPEKRDNDKDTGQ